MVNYYNQIKFNLKFLLNLSKIEKIIGVEKMHVIKIYYN